MATAGVKVKGLSQLRRALKAYDADVSRDMDAELKEIAGMVADDARQRFSAINVRSATGFKPKLRGFGRVSVQQSRRSKGLRPDYGALEMTRALIPAVWAKAPEVERRFEHMLDRLTTMHGF